MALTVSGLPKSLYKYFPPERVDGLASCEVSFSPLSAFNDPFEGRPEITGLSSYEVLKEECLKRFGPEIAEQYSKLPQTDRDRIPFDQFSAMMWGLAYNNLDDELKKYAPAANDYARTFPDYLDKHIGVFCLCEVPDNLLMWAHYTKSHTGFVVEYKAEHSFFNAKRSDSDEFYHLRRVLYRSTRPSADLMNMEGPEFFLIKSDHWSYEHEWRVLKPLQDCDRTLHVAGRDVHLFKYPADAIKSITVGARASDHTVSKIREILKSNPDFADVSLYQAFPDSSHFLVRVRGIAI